MLSVEQIAEFAHEVNNLYCQRLGDYSQPHWVNAPQWQKDSAIAGVEAVQNGAVTSPEDSHIGWMLQKETDGWVHGEVKDPEKKEHPCMVPFSDLPADQQIKDGLFFYAVRTLLGL